MIIAVPSGPQSSLKALASQSLARAFCFQVQDQVQKRRFTSRLVSNLVGSNFCLIDEKILQHFSHLV